MLVVVVHSLLFLWCWLLFFIHCFSTSSLTLPWAIARFLYPFYTFSPAYRRVIRDTSILTFPSSSFTVLSPAFWLWVGIFYPQVFFILCSFPTFSPTTCSYQGFRGNQQFFLEVCRASCWSSKYRPGPSDCLIHSNPIVWFTAIHNLDIQKNSYLKRIKYYHELLVVKTLVICSLLVLNSFCLFKVYVKTRKNTLNKACTTYNRFDETTHQSYFEKAATRFVCLKEAKRHRE